MQIKSPIYDNESFAVNRIHDALFCCSAVLKEAKQKEVIALDDSSATVSAEVVLKEGEEYKVREI